MHFIITFIVIHDSYAGKPINGRNNTRSAYTVQAFFYKWQ
jgi:hypothetical protein